jgi:hypothetical protein
MNKAETERIIRQVLLLTRPPIYVQSGIDPEHYIAEFLPDEALTKPGRGGSAASLAGLGQPGRLSLNCLFRVPPIWYFPVTRLSTIRIILSRVAAERAA